METGEMNEDLGDGRGGYGSSGGALCRGPAARAPPGVFEGGAAEMETEGESAEDLGDGGGGDDHGGGGSGGGTGGPYQTPVPYWAPAAGALPVATERGAAEMETAGTNEGEKKGRRQGKKRSGKQSRRTHSSQRIYNTVFKRKPRGEAVTEPIWRSLYRTVDRQEETRQI